LLFDEIAPIVAQLVAVSTAAVAPRAVLIKSPSTVYSSDSRHTSGIAYLTTEYPHVSHTFIRREITGLEAQGCSVARVALRRGSVVVDPLDREESEKTLHLLEQPKLALLGQIFAGTWLAGPRLATAAAAAWRLGRRSDRGLLRHAAYLFEALALRAYCKRRKIVHVHVHFGTNPAAVAMLTKLLGGPSFSITFHGPDEFDAPIALSLGTKIQHALFVVASSFFCATQLRRWADHAHWQKIHVVRCAIGDEWFDGAKPVPDAPAFLLTVGRLSPQKGHLFLIDAYADAVAAGLRCSLVLVGDGELRTAVEARIRALGLEGRIEITGWLDAHAIRQRLTESRAFVLASFAEGLPVVLMEAMASGRPIITTPLAGIPELVRDGEHGWLVATGDRASLASALLQAGEAPVDRLRAMGAAAQQAVRRNHSLRDEAAKLRTLFEKHVQA
jgi:glycosyltransferase involved in cell wall biosynthesis